MGFFNALLNYGLYFKQFKVSYKWTPNFRNSVYIIRMAL